jgi:hypothetical protein
LSPEELERRLKKKRLLKRRAREVMKHQKEDIAHSKLQCLVTVHEGASVVVGL